MIEVTLNTRLILTTGALSISKIVFDGGAGNDILAVKQHSSDRLPSRVASPSPAGLGNDTLTLLGARVHGVDTATSGAKRTYTVNDADGGGVETVVFEDFNVSGSDTFKQRAADGLRVGADRRRAVSLVDRVRGACGYAARRPQSHAPARDHRCQGGRRSPRRRSGRGSGGEAEGDGAAEAATRRQRPHAPLHVRRRAGRSWTRSATGPFTTSPRCSSSWPASRPAVQRRTPGPPTRRSSTSPSPRRSRAPATFDVAFDQFGGHVQLSGIVEASADVHLHLIVGVDPTDGVYIDTSGADELSIGNIHVTGKLEGEGRMGFLSVELVNPTVVINGRHGRRGSRRAVRIAHFPRRSRRPREPCKSHLGPCDRPRHRRGGSQRRRQGFGVPARRAGSVHARSPPSSCIGTISLSRPTCASSSPVCSTTSSRSASRSCSRS